MKFAVQIENQFGYDWAQISRMVMDTENFSYHSFYICDHFFLDDKSANRNALEAYTVLSAAAAITNRIKLGSLVTGNNYRNPALLAKIIASIDMISSGRMEVGIGAGWKKLEYEAYGYEFPAVGKRMDQLEESIEIIKKLFTKKSPSYDGKYYQLRNAHFSPRPDNPLFIIGGGGERRTLKMVAKYADYCNLFGWLPTKTITRKLDVLREHCRSINRDYDDMGKSLFVPMFVAETQQEVDDHIRERAKASGRSEGELRDILYPEDTPGGWVGTPEMLRDRIEFFASLGFDYYFFQQPIDLSSDMIVKFAELVMRRYYN